MPNLLANPGFTEGVFEPVGQVALVLPQGWLVGYEDNGKLYRVVPAPSTFSVLTARMFASTEQPSKEFRTAYQAMGYDKIQGNTQFIVEQFGTFNKLGPRIVPDKAPVLKPEILVIGAVPPYLDPPRTEPPTQTVTGFKLYGVTWWWLMQVVDVIPGRRYRVGTRDHNWDRYSEDPNDPHWSRGAGGTNPFSALETAAGLTDDNRNFRFRVGADLAGGLDITAPTVRWATGVHIYNRFDDAQELIFAATGNKVTVYYATDNLRGTINGNAYVSRPYLEEYVDPILEQFDERLMALEAALTNTNTVLAEVEENVYSLNCDVTDLKARVTVLEGGIAPPPPPPPPPPEPAYPHTCSTAGLHISSGNHNWYGEFLRICAEAGRPVGLVKSFLDGGAIGEAKDRDARTITVFRTRPLRGADKDEDNPQGDWLWNSDDTVTIANYWMDRLVERWAPDRAKTDYLEVMNEPNPATDVQCKNCNDFMVACMNYANQHNFKIGIGAYSAGCPQPDQVDIMAPAFAKAAAEGHVLCTHDGSLGGLLKDQEGGTALRHRMIKERMDGLGLAMPAVAITEFYWYPSGYQGRMPYSDLQWYLTELAKDPYVLGMAWFTLGDWSFNGPNINVVGQLKNFANLITSLPVREY